MEKTFSTQNKGIFSNFVIEIKKELTFNKKAISICLGGIFGTYIVLGAFLGYNHWGGGSDEIVVDLILALLFGTIIASWAFSDMKTKEERIFSLMTPSGVFSKFLIKWLTYIPVLFALLIAAIYIGDLARIAVFKISETDASLFPRYQEVINPWSFIIKSFEPYGGMMLCLAISIYFFYQAIYFLGAVVWPKLSFLKTFIAIEVIQTIVSILALVVFKIFHLRMHLNDPELCWVWFAVNIILTFALYALTYYRYARSQVVYKLF